MADLLLEWVVVDHAMFHFSIVQIYKKDSNSIKLYERSYKSIPERRFSPVHIQQHLHPQLSPSPIKFYYISGLKLSLRIIIILLLWGPYPTEPQHSLFLHHCDLSVQ